MQYHEQSTVCKTQRCTTFILLPRSCPAEPSKDGHQCPIVCSSAGSGHAAHPGVTADGNVSVLCLSLQISRPTARPREHQQNPQTTASPESTEHHSLMVVMWANTSHVAIKVPGYFSSIHTQDMSCLIPSFMALVLLVPAQARKGRGDDKNSQHSLKPFQMHGCGATFRAGVAFFHPAQLLCGSSAQPHWELAAGMVPQWNTTIRAPSSASSAHSTFCLLHGPGTWCCWRLVVLSQPHLWQLSASQTSSFW